MTVLSTFKIALPWLVVIKLMLGSFHFATPEYFAQQRAGESARLGPLVPPCIGTCLRRRWGQMLAIAANIALSSSFLQLPATAVPGGGALTPPMADIFADACTARSGTLPVRRARPGVAIKNNCSHVMR